MRLKSVYRSSGRRRQAGKRNSSARPDLPKVSVYEAQQWSKISKLWAELDEVSPHSSFRGIDTEKMSSYFTHPNKSAVDSRALQNA
jgi:hypothetical protein